jgi:integrase
MPRYLSQDEIRRFFAVIESVRDRALFTLAYHYGLRVSEISLLEVSDIDLGRRRILVRRVKNGLWGEKPLFTSTSRVIETYIRERGTNCVPALFPGPNGAPLQKRRIQQLFTRYRVEAGISPEATCHSLRHSIATHLLDAGLPLSFVQDHLGHKNSASTAIYARISDRSRERYFALLDECEDIVHPFSGRREEP